MSRRERRKRKKHHEGFWWGVGEVFVEILLIPFRIFGWVLQGIAEIFSGW